MVASDALALLSSLARPFRERYLPFDELTSQLEAWAAAFPSLCRLTSLGQSTEGRAIWLLTLGPEPDRARPSAWIDGNMHAQEVCGSSVALAIAEDVLRLHLAAQPGAAGTPPGLHGLPPQVAEVLRGVRFFVLPRMCPDGAEAILTSARYVRSNPRDRRPPSGEPRWKAADVDGDGLALLMRVADPAGDFVASREIPDLLVPRDIEDEGPFYKLYPEGVVEPWDGFTVPAPAMLSDNDTDLNRNFPYSWAPEPEQLGAGAFPTSEPESRAVVEATSKHPEIFAWMNLHTFGGVYIRPLGHRPDAAMNQADLAVYRQVAVWGERHGGYPTVSGCEEFLYAPDSPLHGDLVDYAYHQRGALAFVCELWDLFKQAGIERKKPFVSHYTHLDRAELELIGRWDRDHNQGRAILPWRPFEHPQLGQVEVGGVDPRVGLVNPSYEQLGEVCLRQAAFFLRVAAMAPRLTLEVPSITELGGDLYRVDVSVKNEGYLPTSVLASSVGLPWNEGLFLDAEASGCELVDVSSSHQALGHLDGWGQGLFGGLTGPYFQRSRGTGGARLRRLVVRGAGALRLRAGCCRTGWVERTVEVGPRR
jgi:hypothetical protein